MIKKSLPDIFTMEDLNKKYINLTFFVEEDNENKLYRIEMDEVTKKYIPFDITPLPSLYYEYEEKKNYIISFLESKHIHFMLDGKNRIVIFDPEIEEYNTVVSPIYNEHNDIYYKKGLHTDKFPSKKMGEAAYELFIKWYSKIKKKETMFDFMQLTMDGGKSAFFENYSISNLHYLSSNKFLIFDIKCNPNHSNIPYNNYTNYCIVTTEKDTCYSGACCVVFNKEMIAKRSTNGEVSITLPNEVVPLVIGKAGETIKNLTYLLGISRLNVISDSLKEVI